MKVLGLDPGEVTGFGLIEVADKHTIRVLDYGTVPIPSGVHPLCALYDWLSQRVPRPVLTTTICAAFEELLDTKGKIPDRCPRAAKEARGVIRLVLEANGASYKSYHPSTIKAAFGVSKKPQMRQAVGALLGLKLKGYPDHAVDALAVALVYAGRELGWAPPTQEMPEPPHTGRPRKADKYEGVDLSLPENRELMRQAIREGVLVPKRR